MVMPSAAAAFSRSLIDGPRGVRPVAGIFRRSPAHRQRHRLVLDDLIEQVDPALLVEGREIDRNLGAPGTGPRRSGRPSSLRRWNPFRPAAPAT